MLIWRNIREGEDFLRVTDDGRFVIRRNAVKKNDLYHYSYDVQDLHEPGRHEVLTTLQAARRQAMTWAASRRSRL